MTTTIAFIGMGEAASAIVTGWGPGADVAVRAYDIKSDDPATAPEIAARCARLGVLNAADPAAAIAGATMVFCTVTADQAVVAARSGAPHLRQSAFWCDMNSCAPSSKQQAAQVVEGVGGRYVDVAVMAPVHPKLNLVPLLLAGPHAQAVRPLLEALPMAPRVVQGPVGAASSIKMIRSVMVKGLEALTAECVLAAVAAGVEDEVLGSLIKSHPGVDWPAQAAYNLERSLVHGVRRAAEMEEVARTLRDLGLPDDMARATVEWQRRIAGTALPVPDDPRALGATEFANRLLPAIRT